MAEIKTYRAENMQEALQLVRRELGPDALILHTRQLPRKSLLPWQKQRLDTEIMAVAEETAPPVAARHIQRQTPQAAQSPAETEQASPPPVVVADYSQPRRSRGNVTSLPYVPPAGTDHHVHAESDHAETEFPPESEEDRRAPALSTYTQHNRVQHIHKTHSEPETFVSTEEPRSVQEAAAPPRRRFSVSRASTRVAEKSTPAPVASQEVTPPAPPVAEPESESISTSPSAHQAEGLQSGESARLEALVNERLDLLQHMLEKLSRQMQTSSSPEIPAEWFELYLQLIESDVDEDYARELLRKLKRHLGAEIISDPELLRPRLRGVLEAEINCSGPIRMQPGQQKVVALVGPTGVGKTTTIAKLASNFRLRENFRLGLITVDTYRIAAVEQLRTYAEIMDLPMQVVTTPEEMRRAVRELSAMDLILIDTAGRSPQDDLRVQELNSFLREILVDEIHLVLSATTSKRHLLRIVEKFQPIQPTSVILSKLDEAPGVGAIANISGQLGLPLSYLTTGQSVPNDIEAAELPRAVNLLLGEEKIIPSP